MPKCSRTRWPRGRRNEPRAQKTNDAGLVAAFATARKDNYLGNPRCVDSLLRVMCANLCDAIEEHVGTPVLTDKIDEFEEGAADVLLGKNPAYIPIIGWNQPGGIDVALVRELNLDPSCTPIQRVRLGLRQLWHGQIYKLWQMEAKGELPENTRWQMEAAFEQFTKLFMGLPMDKPGPDD